MTARIVALFLCVTLLPLSPLPASRRLEYGPMALATDDTRLSGRASSRRNDGALLRQPGTGPAFPWRESTTAPKSRPGPLMSA